jgi:site-specific recombinase XerD
VTGRVNLHSFRHAFGRDYILNGGDLATGAELMGNSVGVMTKHYARFRVKELREKHAKHSPNRGLSHAIDLVYPYVKE